VDGNLPAEQAGALSGDDSVVEEGSVVVENLLDVSVQPICVFAALIYQNVPEKEPSPNRKRID
jgi:hypothetical protein